MNGGFFFYCCLDSSFSWLYLDRRSRHLGRSSWKKKPAVRANNETRHSARQPKADGTLCSFIHVYLKKKLLVWLLFRLQQWAAPTLQSFFSSNLFKDWCASSVCSFPFSLLVLLLLPVSLFIAGTDSQGRAPCRVHTVSQTRLSRYVIGDGP